MKTFLAVTLLAALFGVGLGAGMAYVEVPKVSNRLPTVPETPKQTPLAKQEGQAEKPVEIPEVSTRPKAELPETVFAFGNIERGTSMSHVFIVRNVGQMPLHVEVESFPKMILARMKKRRCCWNGLPRRAPGLSGMARC